MNVAVPGLDERWQLRQAEPEASLREELRTIEMLLLAIALGQEGREQAAALYLERALKRLGA